MIKKRYGIVIVAICLLLMALIYVPAFSIASVFTSYVSDDFGVSRAAFSLHITVSTVSSMISVMLIGKLLSKIPIKKLMIMALLGITICFAAYSAAQRMWQFYLISAIVGPCGVALGNVTISVIISNWFPKNQQGKAIGIAMAGSGLGASALTPVASAVCERISWRAAYMGFAATTLLVMLPIVAFLLREASESTEYQVNDIEIESGISYTAAKKMPAFYLCFFVFFLFAFASATPHFSGYLYLMELGYPASKAASLMSFEALALIVSKISLGAVCDWKNAKFGTTMFALIMTTSYVLFLQSGKATYLPLFAVILFGLSNSINTVADPLIVQEMWGPKEFGRIMSVLYVAYYAGVGVSLVFTSYVFDTYGSYRLAYIIGLVCTVAMAIGINSVYFLRKPWQSEI